jgi:hypothetical protein
MFVEVVLCILGVLEGMRPMLRVLDAMRRGYYNI